MDFGFFCPTRILFGAGRLNDLHKQALPGRKALVVISNGRSTKASGYLSRTVNQLQNAGVATVIFDRIEANPLKSTVMAGASFARENGCDFIVALGGGSVMDASKAISFMATNDGDYWDYVPAGTGKGLPLKHKPLPVVAITTTAGTGPAGSPGRKSDPLDRTGTGKTEYRRYLQSAFQRLSPCGRRTWLRCRS